MKKETRTKRIGRKSIAKRNIRMYFVYRVLGTLIFTMPIFMLFLIDKGLTSFQIFVTQAIYTVTELLLTVPSGAFADKVGRKKTLLISQVMYAVTFVIYGMAGTFAQIVFAEIIFAVSSAMFHGTGEAFIYDTLVEAKQEKKYKKVLGSLYAVQSLMLGIAAVCGGFIAKVDIALPYFVTAVPTLLALIPLAFLKEPRRKKAKDDGYSKMVKESIVFVFTHVKLRNMMYFSAVTTLVGFMGFLLAQPLLTETGMSLEMLGVAMMALALAHGVGNKIAHRFDQKYGAMELMTVFAGVRALIHLLIFLASGMYVVVWFILGDMMSGIVAPLFSEWVNRHSKAENRATILSVSSMSGNLSFTLFSPLVGLLVDAYSTQSAYLMFALILAVYTVRQAVMLLIARKAVKTVKAARC